LKQKSISIGLLELPNKKIMEYMEQYLPMPEWVIVNPQEEEIYVAVTDMDIKSNFEVSVEHIDLQTNHLAFKIRIPYETLAIDPPTDVDYSHRLQFIMEPDGYHPIHDKLVHAYLLTI